MEERKEKERVEKEKRGNTYRRLIPPHPSFRQLNHRFRRRRRRRRACDIRARAFSVIPADEMAGAFGEGGRHGDCGGDGGEGEEGVDDGAHCGCGFRWLLGCF